MRKYVTLFSIAGCVLGGLYFLLLPASLRYVLIDLLILAVAGTAAFVGVVAHGRAWATWRAFGIIILVHVAAQLWLLWQWNLWSTPWHSINVLVMVILVESLCCILAVLTLLLVYRDISVTALALVWVSYPILLVATAARYHRFDRFNAAPEQEQLVLLVLNCILWFLALGGLAAFIGHLIRLFWREAKPNEQA